jgi:hypothetical protein
MFGRIALCLVKLNLWTFCVLGPAFAVSGLVSCITGNHDVYSLSPEAFVLLGLATTWLGWRHVLRVKQWQFSIMDLAFHTGWLALTLAVAVQWPSFLFLALLLALAIFFRYERKHFRRDLGISAVDTTHSKSSPNNSP